MADDNYYDDATVGGWSLTGTGWNVMSADIQTAVNYIDALTATTTEVNYCDGVTSSIQTQIDTKSPIANPTFTGEIGIGAVNVSETELGILEGATLTTVELNYVDGVTSAIQTQIDTKAPIANPTFTGEIGIGAVNVSETELGILEGATLSTTELNYVDGVTSDIQTQIDSKTDDEITLEDQTGTTYTLVIGDQSKLVTMSNAGAITMTVPPNASVAFPVGTQILLYNKGAGQVTVAEGAAVTVNTSSTLLMRVQYSMATLVKIATNEWILSGDLEAA